MATPREVRESQTQVLQDALDEAYNVIEAITSSTYYFAVILEATKRTVYSKDEPPKIVNAFLIVNQNGVISEVVAPPVIKLKPKVGDVVKIVTKGDQAGIVELCKETLPGQMMIVKSVDSNFAYMSEENHPAVYLGGKSVKAGDKVIVTFGRIVTDVVEDKEMEYSFKGEVSVSYKDIAGLDEAKLQIQEALEDPIKHKELFKAYGKKAPKGVLFFGPPGNGKTMLAKAAAHSIADLYKGEPGFISIKGPELLSSYVGATEARIRKLFAEARAFYTRTGNPAIIFIDEADAILPKRGSGKSSDVEKTIVPMFLAEMDGLDEDSGAIVMLATNKPESIDDAVLREGRIDRKIKIGRPDKLVASAIFKLTLAKSKIADTLDIDTLSNNAAEELFADTLKMYEAKSQTTSAIITYGQLISGAAVAGMAQDAIGLAMKRDIQNKVSTPTGVTSIDITKSILNSFQKNKQMDYREQIFEQFEELGVQLTECNKIN